MRLEDGKKCSENVIEIPYATREDLPKFLKYNGFNNGAEIGVYKARFTESLLKAGLRVYAVDPYMTYDDYGQSNLACQVKEDYLARRAGTILNRYPTCTMIRKTSMDAAKDFKPGSLDFVYIDGHHGFKYVAEDLWEWSKIVRHGGIISGHDYAYIRGDGNDSFPLHVRYALEGYLACKKISPLYIIGRHYTEPGEARDKWRSWLFINP